MLKRLLIENLILIEKADIPFEKGLNILSGETGAGKSAIISALGLLSGDRADFAMIRQGAERGIAEGMFDIEGNTLLLDWLEANGIDHEPGMEIILRRELTNSGRTRAFINNQAVQLGILRNVTQYLLEIVGQHANQKLFDLEEHRYILDCFANLTQEVQVFSKSWKEEISLRKELEMLILNESLRLREMDRCHRELEELKSANLQKGEEEDLFIEYTRLSHAEELKRKINEILTTLSGDKISVISQLSRHSATFEQIIAMDPSLQESGTSFKNTLFELQEIAHTLRNYSGRIEFNSERAEKINERLTLIDQLKKRYGNTFEDICTYQLETEAKLKQLEKNDELIENCQLKLRQLENSNQKLAETLTEKRTKAAGQLEKAVTKELRSLNMPKATFICEINPQQCSQYGKDAIQFFLVPNQGEPKIPIKDCASGGELSRLMLALQALLAGKNSISTLIFDEIDANIGGTTASIIGEKLKIIGDNHQVLCITHFPQVAAHSDHHIQIKKLEKDGRTFTTISVLDPCEREKELLRMSGKSSY